MEVNPSSLRNGHLHTRHSRHRRSPRNTKKCLVMAETQSARVLISLAPHARAQKTKPARTPPPAFPFLQSTCQRAKSARHARRGNRNANTQRRSIHDLLGVSYQGVNRRVCVGERRLCSGGGVASPEVLSCCGSLPQIAGPSSESEPHDRTRNMANFPMLGER